MGMIGHFLHSYPQEDNWAWGRWYIIDPTLQVIISMKREENVFQSTILDLRFTFIVSFHFEFYLGSPWKRSL